LFRKPVALSGAAAYLSVSEIFPLEQRAQAIVAPVTAELPQHPQR
jgi:hypothetical protein